MNMNDILASGTITIPLVLALTQGYKMILGSDSKWAKWTPLVSILFGILLAWLFTTNGEYDFKYTLASGITAGLSASGLFSGLKHTSQFDGQQNEEEVDNRLEP